MSQVKRHKSYMYRNNIKQLINTRICKKNKEFKF